MVLSYTVFHELFNYRGLRGHGPKGKLSDSVKCVKICARSVPPCAGALQAQRLSGCACKVEILILSFFAGDPAQRTLISVTLSFTVSHQSPPRAAPTLTQGPRGRARGRVEPPTLTQGPRAAQDRTHTLASQPARHRETCKHQVKPGGGASWRPRAMRASARRPP